MGRLVRIINGDVAVAHRYIATPDYTLYVEDYASGGTPPDGWVYYPDNLDSTDFAQVWHQPQGAHDAYKLGDIVLHNDIRWKSNVDGNVWEPGVSSWSDVSSAIPQWIQPTGAHDAYAVEAVVRHNDDVWVSLTPANVWEPGVSQWRKTALIAPGDPGVTGPPEWVQPTGAGDAYPLNARVKHNGQIWISNYAANVWEPGVFGWTVE